MKDLRTWMAKSPHLHSIQQDDVVSFFYKSEDFSFFDKSKDFLKDDVVSFFNKSKGNLPHYLSGPQNFSPRMQIQHGTNQGI